MLKEYEKREDVMEAKVTGKQQEKLEMQAKVSTVDSGVRNSVILCQTAII